MSDSYPCPNCSHPTKFVYGHRCNESRSDILHCGCFYESDEAEVLDHASRCSCVSRQNAQAPTNALLEAAQALVAADRVEREKSIVLTQARHKRAECNEQTQERVEREWQVAFIEWERAYCAMFEAQKRVLAEARKVGAR